MEADREPWLRDKAGCCVCGALAIARPCSPSASDAVKSIFLAGPWRSEAKDSARAEFGKHRAWSDDEVGCGRSCSLKGLSWSGALARRGHCTCYGAAAPTSPRRLLSSVIDAKC